MADRLMRLGGDSGRAAGAIPSGTAQNSGGNG